MAYTKGPMTEAMYYVLLALINPSHGYRLMSEIEEVSHGRLKMGPGTLYGVLTRMQNDGLLQISEGNGRRKVYRITTEGKEALLYEYQRLQAMVHDGFSLKGSE